jgi:acetylglutamate kinase
MTPPVVMKFGGELLETTERLATVVAAVAAVTTRQPVAIVHVVHGAGKEIDAGVAAAGIEKRQVDGLRITDDRTLDVVVTVLETVNRRLRAALQAAGVAAIGLTGADGQCGLAEPAPPHRAVDGRLVDLGRVGIPAEDADPRLVIRLMEAGFVPTIACIGIGREGRLFNVNADTFAGHLAARLGARRLVIAGTTAGVLNDAGGTVPVVEPQGLHRLISDGTATAGMIAKLRACEYALGHGVTDVVIVDGRDRGGLEAAALGTPPSTASRLVTTAGSRA